jgi:hypothetical protein
VQRVGGEVRSIKSFGVKICGKHLQDLSVDGRIILKYFSIKWNQGMDWIDLAHDRSREWLL